MSPSLALFGINGGGEVFVILIVLVLLFGATKLPKLARAMGQSVGEFKKGLKDEGNDGAPKAESPDAGK